MENRERKVLIISIVVSVLLHLIGLFLLQKDFLLGSTAVKQPEQPKPLELVFEQPKPPPPPEQDQRPQKFYELVENPNATKDKPTETDRLSTESSVNRAPEISDNQARLVPGTEVENEKMQTPSSQEADPQLLEAVRSAMLAYKSSHTFSKDLLTGKKGETNKAEEEPQQSKQNKKRGETTVQLESFKADLIGDFALSTYAWEWAPYWLAFKRKLIRLWTAPPAYYPLGLIHGYTIVRFKVSREGNMYDFQVLRHVGHHSLEESSVNAIESVFPFQPLPDDFPDPYLEVTIRMVYPDLRQYQVRE
jgi:outer membrane biosynthesis protein TonB